LVLHAVNLQLASPEGLGVAIRRVEPYGAGRAQNRRVVIFGYPTGLTLRAVYPGRSSLEPSAGVSSPAEELY